MCLIKQNKKTDEYRSRSRRPIDYRPIDLDQNLAFTIFTKHTNVYKMLSMLSMLSNLLKKQQGQVPSNILSISKSWLKFESFKRRQSVLLRNFIFICSSIWLCIKGRTVLNNFNILNYYSFVQETP